MNQESTDPLPGAATPPAPDEPTVAFCQQCGLGLTASTRRTVGTGIFCERCATMRGTAAATSAGQSAGEFTPVNVPPGNPGNLGPLPPAVGEPNPVLAGFLGLIPGVGAMYNGQYPKGVIHLVIFVVLTSLADNLNWVLWWFVWGWIFYQAFEAYHTAQARRDGLSLPDPFGWNDLGERLGFSRPGNPAPSSSASPRSDGFRAAAQVRAAYAQPTAVPFTAAPPVSPPQYPPPPYSPAEATTGAGPVANPSHPPAAGGTGVPPPPAYGPTYTGVPPSPGTSGSAGLAPGPQRFPAGAAWLIGLGFLFLWANLAPAWRLEAHWLVPALLAALALWTGGRRLAAARTRQDQGAVPVDLAGLAESLLGPAILLTVAILLALQTAAVIPLRHSWPALLIVWGALLLIGRSRPLPYASSFASSSTEAKPAVPAGEDLR